MTIVEIPKCSKGAEGSVRLSTGAERKRAKKYQPVELHSISTPRLSLKLYKQLKFYWLNHSVSPFTYREPQYHSCCYKHSRFFSLKNMSTKTLSCMAMPCPKLMNQTQIAKHVSSFFIINTLSSNQFNANVHPTKVPPVSGIRHSIKLKGHRY